MRVNYFFSETFTNLRRNVLMTVAAISTVAISLLLLGGVQILSKAVDNMTHSWEAQVEIAVFLRDDATQGEIENLESDIVAMQEVKDVSFVSKDEAFEEFKQQWRNQPEFYEVLPEDALPASLRVKLHDADDTEEVASRLDRSPRGGRHPLRRRVHQDPVARELVSASHFAGHVDRPLDRGYRTDR